MLFGRQIISWLLVITWMTFIFIGSTDLLSSHHTSRFIGPFLKWLRPSITNAQIAEIQYFIRKCGHVSEYAVLSVLVWNARRAQGFVKRPDFRTCARFAMFVCVFYASTDEFHQSFYPSRESSVIDVMIDSCGAAIGLTVLWLLGRRLLIWR